VSEAKLKVHHHRTVGDVARYRRHVVLCVTLVDGSTWAVDPAGAQHGQHKPVLRFSDYSRDYVAREVARQPYGTTAGSTFPSGVNALQLGENWSYQNDALYVWIRGNGAIRDLLKAKPSEYDRLKRLLVSHLAAAANVYVDLANGYTVKSLFHPQDTPPRDFETLSGDNTKLAEMKKNRITAFSPAYRGFHSNVKFGEGLRISYV
jgi:hypothetical protein